MFTHCRNEDCKAPLRPTKRKRIYSKQCSKCKSDSYFTRLKNVQKECLEKSESVPEEELFLDDPRASKQGIPFRYKIVNNSNIQSSLGELS